MKATTLAKWEKRFRYLLVQLPPKMVISQYSSGRFRFLSKLKEEIPEDEYIPPEEFSRELWGLKFRSPLFNAAGMFKNGEGYDLIFRQGAGAYLGGTTTYNSRRGNEKLGIYLPFVPYPDSHSASIWLGLPNDGDIVNSSRVKELIGKSPLPFGWSVAGSPDFLGKEKLENLVKGMKLYEQAGIDFIEINESCPNTAQGKLQEEDLVNHLKYIKDNFLNRITRNLPVIVKLSNDTESQQLPRWLDLLFELGYSGVNLGNTSTAYVKIREQITMKEKRLFDFFTQNFGGGISGQPLREKSLELASRAVEYIKAGPPPQEFHVIRTGGIESKKDIQDSERAGIVLNQWFTGYFENFSRYGHNLYRKLFEDIKRT